MSRLTIDETLSIGYSDFCSLFTKEECKARQDRADAVINYSYTYDLL